MYSLAGVFISKYRFMLWLPYLMHMTGCITFDYKPTEVNTLVYPHGFLMHY